MSELSPQAQAVLDAIKATYDVDDLKWPTDEQVAAAALHAAVDQVVPGNGSRRANEIRSEFLAIATELKNQ